MTFCDGRSPNSQKCRTTWQRLFGSLSSRLEASIWNCRHGDLSAIRLIFHDCSRHECAVRGIAANAVLDRARLDARGAARSGVYHFNYRRGASFWDCPFARGKAPGCFGSRYQPPSSREICRPNFAIRQRRRPRVCRDCRSPPPDWPTDLRARCAHRGNYEIPGRCFGNAQRHRLCGLRARIDQSVGLILG